ncbi:F0F1 ATP synthase subunit B [Bacteroidales bacterium OttesenSCG-928-K03]|nr:F0F1 ATP synthase subunit B [Odoribacter sp. OttesenSCG-928-L07]MDL2239035.1 F0F1 ATP synthase subunit B [Bacteroidales bacterium OttesenSCG-928-L14]MDL2240307.1 F0F1 ATP synthase subunit B [Bacteroidales bacterium OttesenSCG-928-K22]MDL2242871.1 F0F1 ATP synthase subunit B [Bacteroidales bacterium OttesenSCG-928-K03]
MSLLLPDPGLVIWMLVAFGLVFFILAKWGWPVITKMAEKRANFIGDSLKSAKEANKQVENLKSEMQQLIDDTREEQARILKDATDSREKIIHEAKQKAISEANKIVEDARSQMQIERENILNELRLQVAELSVNIAEKVIRKELDNQDKQMSVIKEMLDEIDTLKN